MSHVRVDGRVLTDSEHMKMLADEEHEVLETMARQAALQEQQRLDAECDDSGIRRVESLLEGEMSRRVTALTPAMWREMSPVDRRIMTDWIERRMKLLGERLAFVRRNAGADIDVPAYLRASGGA